MMKVKHSKFKNTGLIFELLVRKLTSDTLSQKDSPAIKIIKEFYTKTEISKEYKIYQSLLNNKTDNNDRIYSIIDSVLNESKKLNRSTLRREKYNLIKEIKSHYNLDDFFKSKIPNYPSYASVYTLIEETNSSEFNNPDIIIQNKETLVEHIAKQSSVNKPKKDQLIEEYSAQHKDVRMIAYKILLEKFNTSYSGLSNDQKTVLKEYINNITESPKLRDYVNERFKSVKISLVGISKTIDNQAIKLKINEVVSLIKHIPKTRNVKDNDILNLLQYLELEKEFNNTQ
jgi:hypothetical protein